MPYTAFAHVLASGTVEQTRELPMSPPLVALVVLLIFIALLGLAWAFRNSANKHR